MAQIHEFHFLNTGVQTQYMIEYKTVNKLQEIKISGSFLHCILQDFCCVCFP